MKLFNTSQIKELDNLTCTLEGLSSLELMDRAAMALYQRIRKKVLRTQSVLVVSGPGNNGGDGLAIGRLLLDEGYPVTIVLCEQFKLSADAAVQLKRLKSSFPQTVYTLENADKLAVFEDREVVIDAVFGSGLNRPLKGFYADVVQWINRQKAFKIAIDLPSGLLGEDNRSTLSENIVRADLVLGLQFPRLAFLMAENEPFMKDWELVDIDLHPKAIENMDTPYTFTEREEMHLLLKKRSRFSHKGTCGKGLLIAGSPGMMGAAVLSAKGALRSGVGLLSVRIPVEGVSILQTAVPEAIVLSYKSESFCSDSEPINLQDFTAFAIGPGIRTGKAQAEAFANLVKKQPTPLVLDADALNLLSEDRLLLDLLPRDTILTPHPKEFDRLAETPSASGYERLERARNFAISHQVYLVLKGAYTACISPDGSCSFNSTGNPGMATGGSGDVLTGIVLSLLAQGYRPVEACKLGVYLHGLSGDLALDSQSHESLMASDLAENLGKAFKLLK